MTPEARRRFLAAAAALTAYAAGACADQPPEPHVGTHEQERLDYDTPDAHTDTAASYVLPPPRAPRARAARSQPRVVRPARPGGDVWHALAMCETGGTMDQRATSRTGKYLSFFQWSLPTWRSVGGEGDPRDVDYVTQKQLAIKLQARSGWGQWPTCARKLGLLR